MMTPKIWLNYYREDKSLMTLNTRKLNVHLSNHLRCVEDTFNFPHHFNLVDYSKEIAQLCTNALRIKHVD